MDIYRSVYFSGAYHYSMVRHQFALRKFYNISLPARVWTVNTTYGYWWNMWALITIWRGRYVVNTTHSMGCHQLFIVFCHCIFWRYWCLGTNTSLLQKIQSTRTTRIVSEGPREWPIIHKMSTNIEEQFCRTLLKAHLRTGTEYLSKIETKKSSLNANPEVVLKELGEKLSLDKQPNPRSWGVFSAGSFKL